jgi:hypothetical protein
MVLARHPKLRDCSSFPTVGQINETIFVKCWLLTMGSGCSEKVLAVDKFFASLAGAATFNTTIGFKIDAFQKRWKEVDFDPVEAG